MEPSAAQLSPPSPEPTASRQTSPDLRDPALRLVLYDGLANNAMGALTTGVFLVGFAVELGASNLAIGTLAAVPFFAQLLQIPAVILIERVRHRRAITVWSSGVARVFLLIAAAVALLPAPLAVVVLIAAVAANQALAAIAGCAWNSWMRDLVPEAWFGRFFGRLNAANMAMTVGLGLLAGVAIDAWKDHMAALGPVYGYSILFAVGAAAALLGVYFLHLTPEPPMAPAAGPLAVRDLLATPFRDANYRRLMIFLGSWNFAINLASPFFAVYMLRSLGYTMTTVIALTIASRLANLAVLGLWGRMIDHFNNKAVLRVCAPLFLFSILAWTLTDQTWTQAFTLPLVAVLHILMGIATAGVGLASGNIAMRLSPPGQATAYLAANSVVTAVCASLAPIIGGGFADFFATRELALGFEWKSPARDFALQVIHFQAWTFFFALAFLAGLYSLHRLSAVREIGDVDERVVLQHLFLQLRRSMFGLSSVAGVVRLARFPVEFLRLRVGRSTA